MHSNMGKPDNKLDLALENQPFKTESKNKSMFWKRISISELWMAGFSILSFLFHSIKMSHITLPLSEIH